MATKKKTTPVEETEIKVTEQPVPEVVEKIEKPAKAKAPKVKSGIVTECEQLNVRNAASASATRVAVIAKGTELEINSFESSSEWLKISTKTGIEGYVMAKFITVK